MDSLRLLRGFHHGKPRSLVTRTPDLAILISQKRRSRDTWPPSLRRLRSFPTWVFFHDSLDVEKSTVQMLSWTLEIYNLEFFVAHEDTENKRVRLLTSLPSPTNLTVGGDCRFPDRILSIDQHLSGIRYLTFHLSPPI
jgi:hypothetical protein